MKGDEIMKKSATTRRNFLQTTAAGAVGIVLAKPKILAARASGAIRIEEPFHGAVLNLSLIHISEPTRPY